MFELIYGFGKLLNIDNRKLNLMKIPETKCEIEFRCLMHQRTSFELSVNLILLEHQTI